MSSLAVYSCLQNGGSFFAFRRVCEDDLDNLLVEAIPGKIKVVTEYRVTIWKRKSDLWSLNLTFNSFRAIETWKLTRVIGAPLFITLNVKMLWLFKICSSQWKVGGKGKKSYPRKVFPYFWCEGPRWNYHPPPHLLGEGNHGKLAHHMVFQIARNVWRNVCQPGECGNQLSYGSFSR